MCVAVRLLICITAVLRVADFTNKGAGLSLAALGVALSIIIRAALDPFNRLGAKRRLRGVKRQKKTPPTSVVV